MLKLYGFGPAFGVADASPFVLKIDLLLRMLEVEYEFIADIKNLQKAPKGKLPFIEDKGQTLADSYFIQAYLLQNYPNHLDNHLTPEQQAQAHLITRALDESFYWYQVHSRWACDTTWKKIKPLFFKQMPAPLKWFLPELIRKGVIKNLNAQGVGRHSQEEILQQAEHTLASLDTLLGDNNWFFGDQPSSLDATLYAFLANIILVELDNPLNTNARRYQRLVDYCQRIHQRYYTDSRI